MKQKELICPVCGEQYDCTLMSCPICSFENHLALSEDMSGKFSNLENNRIYHHQEWWKHQQAIAADLEAKKQELIECKNLQQQLQSLIGKGKPLAFLVTDRLNVYCIYEGKNTFGSSKRGNGEGEHQKLMTPGLPLRHQHILIEARKLGEKYEFYISELDGNNTVFLNSESTGPIVEPIIIKDSDQIIIVTNNSKATIQFRININR